MNTFKLLGRAMVVGVVAGMALIGMPLVGHADDAPLSNVAEPDVYQVVAENDLFRVVLATWQPGQKDAFHSHPANAAYRISDCKNRLIRPDGSVAREGEVKAGSVVLQNPVASHAYQNLSDHVCQALIVERK